MIVLASMFGLLACDTAGDIVTGVEQAVSGQSCFYKGKKLTHVRDANHDLWPLDRDTVRLGNLHLDFCAVTKEAVPFGERNLEVRVNGNVYVGVSSGSQFVWHLDWAEWTSPPDSYDDEPDPEPDPPGCYHNGMLITHIKDGNETLHPIGDECTIPDEATPFQENDSDIPAIPFGVPEKGSYFIANGDVRVVELVGSTPRVLDAEWTLPADGQIVSPAPSPEAAAEEP